MIKIKLQLTTVCTTQAESRYLYIWTSVGLLTKTFCVRLLGIHEFMKCRLPACALMPCRCLESWAERAQISRLGHLLPGYTIDLVYLRVWVLRVWGVAYVQLCCFGFALANIPWEFIARILLVVRCCSSTLQSVCRCSLCCLTMKRISSAILNYRSTTRYPMRSRMKKYRDWCLMYHTRIIVYCFGYPVLVNCQSALWTG